MQCNGYRAPRQWSSRDRLATGASSAALIQSLLHVGRCSRFSVLLQSKIAKSQGPLMHKLSFGDAFHAGRLVKLLTIAALAVLGALECPMPTLTSKEGVLEVRLTARQGQAALDTVATPVQNFLLFDYEVIRGAASDGQRSGGNLYPAPTLHVFPGKRLIVHFENGLNGLTIRDYFSPQYTPKGQPIALYPQQMTSSPINLHTHGAHISPRGNADNVLLHIPPGMSNTYTYDIPRNMPQGLYWYHSHLHGLTTA